MTAPTSTRGYVDPYQLGNTTFASLYVDLLEHIPDLTFPLSVPVYAKMRRDPKLSSILAGWTLNLRRAQWQLDPAGCRPDVVAAVADGLGLPIKGKDEAPGAARLRGVSWGEHLRWALGMVPFGFAAAELQADTSDGTARLAGLWERPQWTISHIHTDGKTGALTGVTQDGATNMQAPQIPADRLVWYAREREGSNWAGSSLLRPSYASWLIKEEVRRAYAVANVRWSAGVPVLEAIPGTNPTPGQMAEAAQMAQAMRGSNTGGGSTPPGFVAKILGITGSLPDSQEFLRWLDQQCASSALMNAFELGETPNGSRALGTILVDALHLALESEAEHVADVATRDIAAKIVDWNWGADEPVPRIVVSGVGSRREVTAEALQLLLSSGGLAADPALEAWIRREWRLPEREGMTPPRVTAPGVDLPPNDIPPADTPAADVAAARPRARRTRRQTQPSLFGDDDDAAHRVQQQWDKAKARLLRRWPKLAAPMIAELADQAKAAVQVGDVALLGDLRVSAGVVAAMAVPIRKAGTDLAVEAAAGVVEEAAAQDTIITAPDDPAGDRVRQHADAVARIIAAGYASGAARTGLQLAGSSPQKVRDEVERHLTELGESVNGLVGDNIGSLLSAAQFAGRLAVLEQHPAPQYRANETLDRNTCQPCKTVNGKVFASLRAAVAAYPLSGQYHLCQGRSRCRGFIQPLWAEQPVKAHLPGQHDQNSHGRSHSPRLDLPDLGGLVDADLAVGRGDIEDGFAEALEREYGDGFNVTLQEVISYPDGPDGNKLVTLDVRRDGLPAGEVTLMYYRDDNENLVAYHALIQLESSQQGGRFGADLMAHLEQWYRQAGVSRIEFVANIDVGGYAWAALRYEFADQDAASNVLNRLDAAVNGGHETVAHMTVTPGTIEAALLQAADILDRAERIPFGDPGFPTAHEISQLGRSPGMGRGDQWLGKQVMLGSSWDAVRWLN